MKRMLMVNLHEVEFLEETLKILAQAGVSDCVVREVESVVSHHLGDALEPTVIASIAGLFKQERNINYLINAIVDRGKETWLTDALKGLYKVDRYACSFWFLDIDGYWYHKAKD